MLSAQTFANATMARPVRLMQSRGLSCLASRLPGSRIIAATGAVEDPIAELKAQKSKGKKMKKQIKVVVIFANQNLTIRVYRSARSISRRSMIEGNSRSRHPFASRWIHMLNLDLHCRQSMYGCHC
jgi:hypothetical protein